jgi:branched-chain amino acid transport system ATP-binding protein
MSAALHVHELNGSYNKAPILRGVSVDVAAGEIVALFGANGAGKTTLLRALSGALPVCDGTVELNGRRIDRASTWTRAKLGLAHVPEGRQIFASMTVRENLAVGTMTRRGANRIDDVYALFPILGDRADQRAETLSGGEQQMLAVGRALMASPSVMLIDEMSAGLAPVVTERLVDGLTRIRETGVSVLLVEQAPHFVADVADRAYLMEQGRIVAHGTIDELGGAAAIAELYLGVG